MNTIDRPGPFAAFVAQAQSLGCEVRPLDYGPTLDFHAHGHGFTACVYMTRAGSCDAVDWFPCTDPAQASAQVQEIRDRLAEYARRGYVQKLNPWRQEITR